MPIDKLREKRYRDKINHITTSLNDLKIKPSSSLEKKGIFYCIQTAIESAVDMISMLTKDIGLSVKDDKQNIQNIIKERSIDPSLGEKLISANGMRNIIVHRYNGIDEELVLNSINEIETLLTEWLDIFEEILNELASTEED